jgi:DNA polymerase III epsilon subunit-like protein
MDLLTQFTNAWRLIYGPLPEDYTVIDLESSGYVVESDIVLQVGWLTVVGGQERARKSVILDWSQVMDKHTLAQLSRRLADTSAKMKNRGKTYEWSIGRLQAEGVHPKQALTMLASTMARKPVLVGHNPWRFDAPMLDRLCQAQMGMPLAVPETQLIDTAAMVKSMQSGALPRTGETYRAFSLRANAAGGSKYRSSLDEYCVTRFKLIQRYGVNTALAHDAAYDCYLTHLVYEDIRRLLQTGMFPADELVQRS